MRFAAIFFLAFAAMCEDGFKGDSKKDGPGVPPTIRLPENLRIRVNATSFFNIAIGMDVVILRLSLVRRVRTPQVQPLLGLRGLREF